jgi:hypothetical protein
MRAIEQKDRAPIGADDMNVRRRMIVRIDNHPQPIEAQDRRHAGV